MKKYLILVNVPTPSPVLDHVSYCATNHVSQAASKDGRNVCYNKKIYNPPWIQWPTRLPSYWNRVVEERENHGQLRVAEQVG